MAANLGFEDLLVSDATAAFNKTGPGGREFPADLIHETELACLNDEFATVIGTEELLKRFVR